jgi:hypothetical protein
MIFCNKLIPAFRAIPLGDLNIFPSLKQSAPIAISNAGPVGIEPYNGV